MRRARRTDGNKPVLSEVQEQMLVLSWWALYAKMRNIDERLLIAIANGSVLAGDARQRAMQMQKLKATGLRPGVPDLFLAMPKFVRGIAPQELMFAGMFCEMKRIGAPKPKKEQIEYADLLRRQGYNAIIAYGSDEAIRAIKAYIGS